jgi:hypothetical protein
MKCVLQAHVHVSLYRNDQSLKPWLQYAPSADVFDEDIRVCYN